MLFALIILNTFAQVGIGTNTPDNSAMLQVQSTEKGFLLPQMSSAQRASIAAPASGLQVYDSNTNSIWYFNGTFWVNTQAMASVGDVKSGIQPNDHSGWVLLDGSAINTLSPNQQAAATALGLSGTIPNAGNSYLSQNGQPLASVGGANTSTISQANLPNVNFTGTAASAGAHNHGGAAGNAGSHNHSGTTSNNGTHSHSGSTSTNGWHSHGSNANGNGTGLAYKDCYGTPSGIDISCNEINNFVTLALDIYGSGYHNHTLNINNSGDHNHSFTTNTVSDHNHSISNDGAHSHSVTVASGGSGTPLNIAPRTLSVNMFIYLFI